MRGDVPAGPALAKCRAILAHVGSYRGSTSENARAHPVRPAGRLNVIRKRFWTHSVWTSGEAIIPFVRTEPHGAAVTQFAGWAGEDAAFVRWGSSDASLNWDEALTRLKTPTFFYAKHGEPTSHGAPQ